MATGVNSGLYKFLLVLHILAAVVGFGSVFLAGVFGAKAQARGGREGLAISEVVMDVSEHWSMWFIYAVPLLGILLILVSKDVWKFSQMWISLSFLLYIVGVGVTHAVLFPSVRRMNSLGAEMASGAPSAGGGPPPQGTEMDALGKRVAAVGMALNLLVVAILFLMVFKPGL